MLTGVYYVAYAENTFTMLDNAGSSLDGQISHLISLYQWHSHHTKYYLISLLLWELDSSFKTQCEQNLNVMCNENDTGLLCFHFLLYIVRDNRPVKKYL